MKQTKEKDRINSFYVKIVKRFLDIFFASLLLLLLSPLFLFVSLILLCTLRGKIMFTQYRPGQKGRVFKLYKFRSMNDKKDENGKLLEDDKRVTKFGKFLRRTCIDELPQLYNILIGDMSFIGPRPRLVKDMVFYDLETLKTYSIKPGLTGLSQITGGRGEAPWEEIFKKDQEYSVKVSFWFDVKIVFRTIWFLLQFKGDVNMAGTSKRDYYYSDYLLKTGKINQEQYNQGLSKAEEIIESEGYVEFQKNLHTEDNV